MVDDCRDSAIRIELQVLWPLLFTRLEVEVDGLIGQSELFHNQSRLPAHIVRTKGTTNKNRGQLLTSHWDHRRASTV